MILFKFSTTQDQSIRLKLLCTHRELPYLLAAECLSFVSSVAGHRFQLVASLDRESRGGHSSSQPATSARGIFDKQTRRKSLTIATERG